MKNVWMRGEWIDEKVDDDYTFVWEYKIYAKMCVQIWSRFITLH